MVISYQDQEGIRLHSQFQDWREENGSGYFVSFRKKSLALLHLSPCHHPGPVKWDGWEPSPRRMVLSSLTTHRKVCSVNQSELLSWADQNDIIYRACKHCLPGGPVKQRTKKVTYSDYSIDSEPFSSAGEVVVDKGHEDGRRVRIEVDRYERDPRNRKACIEHYKPICVVCGFESSNVYRDVKDGYIHVHHLKLVSQGKRKIDPKKDLRPVCPNCHAMLHTRTPPWTPAALKKRLRGFARVL